MLCSAARVRPLSILSDNLDGQQHSETSPLKSGIRALNHLDNPYPERRRHDCSGHKTDLENPYLRFRCAGNMIEPSYFLPFDKHTLKRRAAVLIGPELFHRGEVMESVRAREFIHILDGPS